MTSNATHFVVLGGGLSGLCTAYFMRVMMPKTARIVIVESSKHIGGWIDTRMVNNTVCEQGPHSFRWDQNAVLFKIVLIESYSPRTSKSATVIDLIASLGLQV